jgi:hypothetical protein
MPEPTPIDKLQIATNQIPILIEVYMPEYREAIENSSVKKTLTIPLWINKLAEEKKINFSQLLQDALKVRLGIEKRPRKMGK